MRAWQAMMGMCLAVTLLAAFAPACRAAEGGPDAGQLKGLRVAPPTNPVDKEIADALRNAMQKLYGVNLAVLADGAPADGPVIIAGKITEAELAKVAPGGHVIKCDAAGVVIAGQDSWCTLYGVYAFLERLGYLRYGREHSWQERVTKPETRTIPALAVFDKPAFAYRGGLNSALRQVTNEWADCRRGMNPELFTPKTGSDLWMDHTAGYLVPVKLYYADHPEYYAMMENGKRVPNDPAYLSDHRMALCLSNPGVTQVSIQRALGWVAAQPYETYFNITYGDSGIWCQCPDCLKLDPAPRQYANRLLHWVIPVAEAIGKKYPEKTVWTFAYGGTDVPPAGLRLPSNMAIIGSTGMGNILFLDHYRSAEGAQFDKSPNVEKIDSWCKIAPGRFMVCEYVSGAYQPAMVDNLAARLRFYQGRKMFGLWGTYGEAGNFRPVWNYVLARLEWDPQQDPEKLAEEVIGWEYGPAAQDVTQFFRLIHQRYQETLAAKTPLKGGAGGYPAGFYSDDFTKQAMDCFARANEKTRAALAALGPAAQQEKSRLTTLQSELAKEERLFIRDVMTHPGDATFNDAAKDSLRKRLDLMFSRAGTTDAARIALAREIHHTAVEAESVLPGTQAFVEDWLRANKFPSPKGITTADGVKLPADVFMYSGYGPAKYDMYCPPNMAVGIYVKGNSYNRSHWMEARFDLAAVPGDGAATMEILGQDSDHPLPPAEIRIVLNDETIYEGKANVVKKNWSRQSFNIPAGALRAGENVIQFYNVSDLKSIQHWYERWFMLSDATITFKK